MCDICGISEDMLPKLYESADMVGTLTPDMAEKLGLSADVKVVAGAGDNAAAAVATGTVGDGKCNISLGTSGTIFISSKKFGERMTCIIKKSGTAENMIIFVSFVHDILCLCNGGFSYFRESLHNTGNSQKRKERSND